MFRRVLTLALLFFAFEATAQISFVGCEHQTNNSSKTHTVSVHASTIDDDLLVAFGHWGDDDHDPVTGTGPAAFTEIDERDETAGTDNATWIGYRVASSEPGSYDFTGVGSGTENGGAAICVFRGVSTSNPIDTAYSADYENIQNDASPDTALSVTTTTDGAWVVHMFAPFGDVDTPTTAASGYTMRVSVDEGFSRVLSIQSKEVATAGAESPGEVTFDGAASTVDSGHFLISLRPDSSTRNDVTLTSVSATSVWAVQSETTCDCTSGSDILTGCADTSWIQKGALLDMSACFADLTDRVVDAVTSSTIDVDADANATQSNITVTQDTYFSQALAANDEISMDFNTSEGNTITLEADGDIRWTDTCGGCRTEIDFCINYNVGDSCPTTEDTLVFFNDAPEFDTDQLDEEFPPLVLKEDVAMSSIDVSLTAVDANQDAMTFAVESGTLPAGLTLSAAGTLSGTPTTEDESGETLALRVTDTGGLVDQESVTIYVVDTWTMPDITGDTLAAAQTTITTAAPWLTDQLSVSVSFDCAPGVAKDDIISQTPAASAEAEPDAVISAVISTAANCSLRRRRQ